MYPGTNLWYSASNDDRCYEWDKFFVNNENIIEEGKIIYKNPKYSLQGTTQGNGLTGGLPPVRFSM